MKNYKLSNKFMIMFCFAASLFNYVIDCGSIYGIFSLLMTFLFIMFFINYIVYNLQAKNASKKAGIICELYFTFIFIASLLMLSTLIFKYSLGVICSNIIMFIMSPLNGIRFLIKSLIPWNILICVLSFIMIFIIRKTTKIE